MANIKVKDFCGSDLFNDSESFLMDISEDAEQIAGGAGCTYTCGHSCSCTGGSDAVAVNQLAD
jgi:hypothetical protein